MPTTEPPLRIAMIGGGINSVIGRYHHLAIARTGLYEVVAGAFSADPSRNAQTGEALGVAPERTYNTVTELIAAETKRDDGVEVAVVLTPNHLHAAQTKECLDAGLHVVCEKPLTTTVEDARSLVVTAEERNLVLTVTHTYTGYEVVRRMRSMIRDGAIGDVAVVNVQYPQDWLATAVERAGNNAAAWRTDPKAAGAGCVSDIGTHAYNLIEFVTGLAVTEVLCELRSVVPGRLVDDNVNALLRLSNGATGMIWASQVAHGSDNDLQIRVVGRSGTLHWSMTDALNGTLSRQGEPDETISAVETIAALASEPVPMDGDRAGPHVAAFATLYGDAAANIRARKSCDAADPTSALQLGEDGARAVAFVDACLASSSNNATWIRL